ncbi:MAG: hypothetical protein WEB03_06200 [Nitriliruptor sp.]|uniref:hypothetical protein n=1 Tax=Nitriliruptor sp. TaxID=2448056 RepID=UPI00349FEAE5
MSGTTAASDHTAGHGRRAPITTAAMAAPAAIGVPMPTNRTANASPSLPLGISDTAEARVTATIAAAAQ